MHPTRVIQGLTALTLSVFAAGCGGSDDADQFVGTWMITQASATIDCSATLSGSTPLAVTPAGNVELVHGATSALTAISPSELDGFSICDFKFDVKGPVATMQAGQSCVIQGFSAPPYNAKLSPTTWTFSVTGANSAEEVGSGTFEVPTVDANNNPNGTTICQYTGHMATLTRVAKN